MLYPVNLLIIFGIVAVVLVIIFLPFVQEQWTASKYRKLLRQSLAPHFSQTAIKEIEQIIHSHLGMEDDIFTAQDRQDLVEFTLLVVKTRDYPPGWLHNQRCLELGLKLGPKFGRSLTVPEINRLRDLIRAAVGPTTSTELAT